ncbi:MAG: ABC transporter ATP-binding protein [Gammaproteobacteria bacterium]|nr:ABC transporter ATP-binding protein [Gammaproteobacteria bacterium]
MSDLPVEVSELSRRFGNTQALDKVNFRAEKGKVYGLVGANGAGKSTLIKHIMGLLRAKSGSVQVFGQNPVHHPESVLSRMGYLSENRDIPDWMTIEELMRYTQAYHQNWDVAYAEELLATFDLDQSKKIRDLSRGMRAQVALVNAVAHRPELLILDEPSSGLDAVVRMDILNTVVRTISDEGRTVIFSSHLLEEVERMSDHVTMIHQGKVVLDGPLESLGSAHHFCNVRFEDSLDSKPLLANALATRGEGRSWTIVHTGTAENFSAGIKQLNGKIVESRNATLEEIFIARVGRGISSDEVIK